MVAVGYILTIEKVTELTDKLYNMSVKERKNLAGLQEDRADVIAGGALILLEIMKKVCAKEITVSEADNLEGYLIWKNKL